MPLGERPRGATTVVVSRTPAELYPVQTGPCGPEELRSSAEYREGCPAPDASCVKGPPMGTASNPSFDGHEALSPWERKVLVGIEDDLTANDPQLADELRRLGSGRVRLWWPLSTRSGGLLVVVLCLLAVVGALLPAWWVVLVVAVALVVVPWLLLAAMKKDQSD